MVCVGVGMFRKVLDRARAKAGGSAGMLLRGVNRTSVGACGGFEAEVRAFTNAERGGWAVHTRFKRLRRPR